MSYVGVYADREARHLQMIENMLLAATLRYSGGPPRTGFFAVFHQFPKTETKPSVGAFLLKKPAFQSAPPPERLSPQSCFPVGQGCHENLWTNYWRIHS